MIGEKFNKLIVRNIVIENTTIKNTKWLCQCSCGEYTAILGRDLLNNKTRSCGCFRIESISRHGMSKYPAYGVWQGIVCRCECENQKGYPNYGGRNIKVREPWRSNPETFIKWYNLQLSLRPNMIKPQVNRIDNDGDYFEGNCEVIPLRENLLNRRCNLLIEVGGQKVSAARFYYDYEMSEESPMISYTCFIHRIERGWSVSDAIKTPPERNSVSTLVDPETNNVILVKDYYYSRIDRNKISYASFVSKSKRTSIINLLKLYGK